MRKIDPEWAGRLETDQVLSSDSIQHLKAPNYIFSLFWELRTLLYTGVLLLSTGLGILVYKNIDTIGHQAILFFLALVTIGCHLFCYKKNPPFAWTKTNAQSILYDYLLLLGSLCLLTFLGYLHYQYRIFGTRYGLASFIPMVWLFFSAYYFDHLGILSLAITNLAAWAGIVVTPAKLLAENDFDQPKLIYTGIALGIFLLVVALLSKQKGVKAHFDLTYKNFGGHLLYISLIAGMVHYDNYYWAWLLPVLAFSYVVYRNALKEHSFYFLLALILYAYGAISYSFLKALHQLNIEHYGGYITNLYLLISALLTLRLLVRLNKKMKSS
jgi:hypothetical protein